MEGRGSSEKCLATRSPGSSSTWPDAMATPPRDQTPWLLLYVARRHGYLLVSREPAELGSTARTLLKYCTCLFSSSSGGGSSSTSCGCASVAEVDMALPVCGEGLGCIP